MKRLLPLIGPLVVLIIWSFITYPNLFNYKLIPGPLETLNALIFNSSSGSLITDSLITLKRTLTAFLVATLIGVPLGLILGLKPNIYKASSFLLDFFRSMPTAAIIPLFMIIFGLGEITKIAIACFGSTIILIFHTAQGVKKGRPGRLTSARTMGAKGSFLFRTVVLPQALPHIVTGARLAISLTLILVVVSEMFIGSSNGLGYRVIDSQLMFDMPGLYSNILTLGGLGYIVNLLIAMLEKKFIHWSGK